LNFDNVSDTRNGHKPAPHRLVTTHGTQTSGYDFDAERRCHHLYGGPAREEESQLSLQAVSREVRALKALLQRDWQPRLVAIRRRLERLEREARRGS
jgi:hypothetical protein